MFIRKAQRAAAVLLVAMSMVTSSAAFADGNENEGSGTPAARQWTNSSPATLPNLIGPSIAYDETNSALVLFGGVTPSGVSEQTENLWNRMGIIPRFLLEVAKLRDFNKISLF